MNNSDKFARANKVLEIAARMAEKERLEKGHGYSVENAICNISLHDNYSEPGYSGELIALGDWNAVDIYDETTQTRKTVSDLPKRVCNILERLGFECEWNEEWTACCDCNGLVRTQGDSYSWTASFQLTDDGAVCCECLKADPESYLSSLEGNSDKANTIDEIDPCDHGYVKVNEDSYAAGWYKRNDSPKKIAKELESKGVSRYLFGIDSCGQFETEFSVFVHESEESLLRADVEECTEDCCDGNCCAVAIATKAPIAKVDVPCKQCGRNVYADDAACWCCEVSHPGKK